VFDVGPRTNARVALHLFWPSARVCASGRLARLALGAHKRDGSALPLFGLRRAFCVRRDDWRTPLHWRTNAKSALPLFGLRPVFVRRGAPRHPTFPRARTRRQRPPSVWPSARVLCDGMTGEPRGHSRTNAKSFLPLFGLRRALCASGRSATLALGAHKREVRPPSVWPSTRVRASRSSASSGLPSRTNAKSGLPVGSLTRGRGSESRGHLVWFRAQREGCVPDDANDDTDAICDIRRFDLDLMPCGLDGADASMATLLQGPGAP
jgi:hypothetical protein